MVKIVNRLPDDEDSITASGLDNAVDALSSGMGKVSTGESYGKGKALYKAFTTSRLPEMREEMPGLKLSQYQERLFDEWKLHPDNPKNQKAARRAGDGAAALGYDPGDDDVVIEGYEL
jgi:Coiled-coil domain-containing protein 124 /Oxs1